MTPAQHHAYNNRTMSEIHITRHHGLSHKKARAAAERVAEELSAEFNLQWEWNGDVLHFHRSGVDGQLAVGKKEIEIRARLGFLLSAFRSGIEEEIHKFCDENFGPS